MYFGCHLLFFFKGYIPFIVIKYWLKLPRLKLVSSLGLSFHPKSSSWLHVPWWDQPHCCRVSEGEGLCQSVLFRCCWHAAFATFLLPVLHLGLAGSSYPRRESILLNWDPVCRGGRERRTWGRWGGSGCCLQSTWSWRPCGGIVHESSWSSPFSGGCVAPLSPFDRRANWGTEM